MLKRPFCISVIALVLLPMAANAGLVGSRDSSLGGGVYATDGWIGGNFKIAWNISYAGNKWHYQYTLTTDFKTLSHWILQVSPDRVLGDFSNFNPAPSAGPKTYDPANDPGQSNPYLPGPIYGLKWDTSDNLQIHTYTFETEYQPVWGNFYAKDGIMQGQWATAMNQGFQDGVPPPNDRVDQSDYLNFIPVPDTKKGGFEEIPEAGSLALCGFGCLGLLLLEWNRRRK
jgi:hypothetical protein